MKNILKNTTTVLLFFLLTACGGNKDNNKDDNNLTPLQNQAVTYVRKHLNKGEKLEDYKIVEEKMPAAIIVQPFKNLRNTVFKAGLDYQSCKTRGLDAGMKMAENNIENARLQILSTLKTLEQNLGDSKSLIVLARLKTSKSHDGSLRSLIVVFDPENMEVKEWLPVTTPIQNTVALVVCAQDNIFAEYAKEQNHDLGFLVDKVSNPVLKFVLESKAL